MRGSPHRCAVIFVDNSGTDVILGIYPFARELLSRGSHVSLTALITAVLIPFNYSTNKGGFILT